MEIEEAPGRAALIVFAKVPSPGAVKTRLTALLTPEDASRLYDAFLRDALDQYRALDVAVRLYLAPSDAGLPGDLAGAAVSVHTQQGQDLGARMLRAFVETFAAGYERIVVIGTDHPTLPTDFIAAAFDLLHEPLSVVMGPSEDGGYYLLGLNELYPALFRDIVYSRPDVFDRTMEKALATSAEVTVLPPWYDVDEPAMLARLAGELAESPSPPPRTAAVVQRLLAAYPALAPLSDSQD